MNGRLAVDAKYGGMETDFAPEFALRAAADVQACVMRAGTDDARWFLLIPEVVVFIAEAFGALGDSIEGEVLADLEALTK